jgi:two-component system, LytTR family, sensor kinase
MVESMVEHTENTTMNIMNIPSTVAEKFRALREREHSFPWRTVGIHCTVWLFITGCFVLLQSLNGAYPRPLRTLLTMICAIGGYYVNTEILVERYFETRKYVLYVVIALVCISLTTTVIVVSEFMIFEMEILRKLLIEPRRFVAAVVWISVTVALVGLLNATQRNRSRREHETQELLSKHKEAELLFLRSQINPHFLFNTLNNIYALAIVQSPQTAPMLMRLSKLLRYSIYTTQKPLVALREEIAEIRELLTLFELRSEEPMKIDFTVSGGINGQNIEPMILFSLVENCLKHSNITHNADGFITINLVVQNEMVYFSTLNSKDDSNRQKDSIGGVGLVNIRQRLALKYGDKAGLMINDSASQFEVCLTIPFLS